MTNDFNGFGLPEKLLQALTRMQFNTPTPIQARSLPFSLAGRDILGTAQTGTGKTGAFGIPLMAGLMNNPEAAALIMTPTRELATQVMAALQQMIPVKDIRTALLIGGEAMPKQFRQLQGQPRLIVGTPGRINDHLQRKSLKLNNVRFLVLDETDRMLDMGFGVQIERIVQHIPQERQTMLFSATLPGDIVKMAQRYLKNPERISVGSTTAAAPNLQQELIQTQDSEKFTKLLEQLAAHEGSAIIFVRTKFGTERLADRLTRQNQKADAIHGNLRQSRRDRVIQSFRDKKFRILVATDIAARGLDVPHIELVINYDLPQCPEDYIHRIGRTARAGASGKAINFLTPGEHQKWNAIARLMNPNASPRQQAPKGERQERHRSGRRSEQRSGQRSEHRSEYRQDNRRPDNRFENRSEPRSEQRADRPDYREDRRPEQRSEQKAGHRSEHRSEQRQDQRRTDTRSEFRSGQRSDRRHSENRSDRPEYRSEQRPEHRSERRFEPRSGDQQDQRGPDNRSEFRSGQRSERRSGDQQDQRRTDTRSEFRSGQRSERRSEQRSDRPDHREDRPGSKGGFNKKRRFFKSGQKQHNPRQQRAA
jgi:superfamily II DNA/RNA helicase